MCGKYLNDQAVWSLGKNLEELKEVEELKNLCDPKSQEGWLLETPDHERLGRRTLNSAAGSKKVEELKILPTPNSDF